MPLWKRKRILLSGGKTGPVPPRKRKGQPRPIAWVTWTIIATTVAVFLLQLAEVQRWHFDRLGQDLAFSQQAWSQHRYWTVLTYAWAHATSFFGRPQLFWLHVASNLFPLYYLGPILEDMLGRLRFLVLYVGGALAAALVWLIWSHGHGAIMGASGAAFALLAAAGTAAPRARAIAHLLCFWFVMPRWLRFGVLTALICSLEVVQMIFGWMPQVAHAAHLGGAAFGFLYISLLRWRVRRMNAH